MLALLKSTPEPDKEAETELPYPTDDVGVGDWVACKAALSIPGMNRTYKILRCKQYLGPHIRALPKHSMIFTPTYLAILAAQNKARREAKFPYYAKLASLYLEIEELEKAL